MKKIKYLIFVLITSSILFSCISDDIEEVTDILEMATVEVNNPFIRYVIKGDSTYTVTGTIYQGDSETNAITIYKTFTNAVTGSVSNKVWLTTINIPNTELGSSSTFEFSFAYRHLSKGIIIDDSSLPSRDGDLNAGDSWSLTYVLHTKNGIEDPNALINIVAAEYKEIVAEFFLYEGVYTTLESEYWKKGALQSNNWVGRDRIIEGVSKGVYRHVGLATWDDNEFFFTVDEATGVITVLDVDLDGNPQLLNGSPIMTCEGIGFPFEYITCDATTSVAIPDPVNGKHELKFTVGYSKASGQNRELFEHLVKK